MKGEKNPITQNNRPIVLRNKGALEPGEDGYKAVLQYGSSAPLSTWPIRAGQKMSNFGFVNFVKIQTNVPDVKKCQNKQISVERRKNKWEINNWVKNPLI